MVEQIHDTIRVPIYKGKEISRLRERGHAPYRCTRCFKEKASRIDFCAPAYHKNIFAQDDE